jgi:hypothetical protein
MLHGRFAYSEPRGQIAGFRDKKGRYYVREGHYRIVAALEILQETGNPDAILQLLQWGLWTEVDRPPTDYRPLPARDWWGSFRNWIGI